MTKPKNKTKEPQPQAKRTKMVAMRLDSALWQAVKDEAVTRQREQPFRSRPIPAIEVLEGYVRDGLKRDQQRRLQEAQPQGPGESA